MRLLLTILLLVSGVPSAQAHDVRPAYLEITEQPQGEVAIVWKTTMAPGAAVIAPHFSTGWTEAAPSISHGGDAIVKTWRIPQPRAPLAGVKVDIQGLETSITDVLLRVVFADGSELTCVLRPSDASLTLP